MDNIEPMEIGHPTNYLFKISACFLLLDFGIFDYVVKKLPIFDILHDQK